MIQTKDISIKNGQTIEQELVDFLNKYLNPSFGSMTKRDVDIEVFLLLQNLGLIDENPKIYDVVNKLQITSSRARNLIYQSSLRKMNEQQLNEQLMHAVQNPHILVTGDRLIGIEIDNPLVIDFAKKKLFDLGYITDGSFSAGLLRMTTEAFSALVVEYMEKQDVEKIHQTIVNEFNKDPYKSVYQELKINKNDNDKGVVQKFILWFLDKAGAAVVKKGMDAISISTIKDCFKSLWNTAKIVAAIGKIIATIIVAIP